MITYLTKKGNELMGSVIGAESVLNFTKIQFSDGHDWHTLDLNMLREEIYNATALHHEPLVEVSFESKDGSVQGETGLALLKSKFTNANMESSWHVTEVGLWAQDGEIEGKYLKTTDKDIDPDKTYFTFAEVETPDAEELRTYYERIPNSRFLFTTDTSIDSEKTYYDKTTVAEPTVDNIASYFEAAAEVLYAVGALDLSKAPWIPQKDEIVSTFDFNIYVYVGDETNVTAVLTVNADKASQADLDDHKNKRNNPHEVTKDQVGLGNVPNVTTNDQKPTFEEPEGDVVKISSGEKMSTLLGKIAKLFSAVFQHFANKNNPHEVTAAQINAASVQHYHNAKTDITSGVLPVIRGGTGVSEGAWFDGGRMLKQSGYVNCDSQKVWVPFHKPFKDTRYTLTFQTSGSSFIPRWKNVEKHTNGFYMNRTVGIDSTPLKNFLKSLFPLPSQSEMREKIDELFGASQAADWFAVGQAAD